MLLGGGGWGGRGGIGVGDECVGVWQGGTSLGFSPLLRINPRSNINRRSRQRILLQLLRNLQILRHIRQRVQVDDAEGTVIVGLH